MPLRFNEMDTDDFPDAIVPVIPIFFMKFLSFSVLTMRAVITASPADIFYFDIAAASTTDFLHMYGAGCLEPAGDP
jgi:hypothetical protein